MPLYDSFKTEFNFGDYFRCDHLVCTLSSGLCRLAYELKQSRSLTTGDDVTSLDDDHYSITLCMTLIFRVSETNYVLFLPQNNF